MDFTSPILHKPMYGKLEMFQHGIRISDILSWVRNSYLTHVKLPRLSHMACSLVVLLLT